MPGPTVLSLSSQVAYGHVGNSATIVALQTLGCTVIDIPTIILSSHPGHGACTGIEIPAEKIDEILNVLWAQGRLDKVDAVISGYIKSPQQAAIIKKVIERIKAKNPAAIYCCDPVIGDELPGIYVAQAVANAIKSELAILSDILTPNLFEFQFLTGQPAMNMGECIDQAHQKFKAHVLLTSAPIKDIDQCGTLLISPEDTWMCTAARIDKVPKGTGDLLTGLFVGHYLATCSYKKALAYACGQLRSVLIESTKQGGDELSLSPLMVSPCLFKLPPAQPV
jgi:pyridoxine kinase